MVIDMKVMVILHKDVYNIPTYHVVKEMLERNYEIDCYALFMGHNHLRMFDDLHLSIQSISEIKNIEQYDFIYSATGLRGIPQIFELKKYIFSFSTAFMDDIVNYGDYTFTQRDFSVHLQNYDYPIDTNNELKSKPGMVVGNPKYDSQYTDSNCPDSKEINNKQILFIDAGHFPYGKAGKMEEAKMLIDIANKFPDYQVIIKPRFLHDDKDVTHRNAVHLYDCINEAADSKIPANLHCLYKHVDLEELVKESALIITPDLTTTYLEIARYDKAGLIAADIPSETTITHSKERLKRLKSIEQRSGLRVNYKDICNYIPQGKKCNKEHVTEMGLTYRNASVKMVDTMEKIYQEFIAKDVYPSANGESYISFEEVMSFRYLKALFDMYEGYVVKMEFLNFSDIENQLREYFRSGKIITAKAYQKMKTEIADKISQVILEQKDLLVKDKSSRGYYLQELYANNLLETCNAEEFKDDALYYYFFGKNLVNVKKEYKQAVEALQRYFDLIKDNDYEETLADMNYFKESATYWLAFSYYQMGEYEQAKIYFEQCQKLTANGHKKAKEYLELIEKCK